MSNCTIVIAHSQYIVLKGLATIIHKIENSCEIISVSSAESLAEVIYKNKPDIVLYESSLYSIVADIEEDIVLVRVDGNNQVITTDEKVIQLSTPGKELTAMLENIIKEFQNSDSGKNTDELSDRENDIVRHVAIGYTNQEIADKLFISMHTVITHRKNITRKLGIKTVSGLTVYALINKLVQMSEVKK